jgi:eukaryotic-like serine/threonine-protein kinase
VVAAEQHPFAFVPTRREPLARIIGLFVGPPVRALAAALLLAGCALWVHQNGLLPGAEARTTATKALNSGDFAALEKSATANLFKSTNPLEIGGIPPRFTSWIDGWNTGFAGLLLLASLFYRGNVMAVFVLLGAAVAAIGHQHGIRTVDPLRAEHVALMLGSVMVLIGFRTSR